MLCNWFAFLISNTQRNGSFKEHEGIVVTGKKGRRVEGREEGKERKREREIRKGALQKIYFLYQEQALLLSQGK